MQAAWRLLRGRPGPFLAGKLDAVRVWREVLARRRVAPRSPISAVSRPHFALSGGSLGDVRNHLRRPPETTQATAGDRYPG